MHFIHDHSHIDETIAAIATPQGEGGVAIVRISGKEAVSIANRVFSGNVSSYQTHTAHYGQVIDEKRNPIDSALVIPMLGTRSYTGEDTVEIHCHGGSLITRRVLDAVLKGGARPAGPGEFTQRAFLNGKLDLAQAEAVQELICAKNEKALDAAEKQLQGALSEKVAGYQQALTGVAAILEAWVDFPEEGLEFATFEELRGKLASVKIEMQALQETFHDGRIVHDGLSLCLIGCPNVGKSSLMNALLDKDRAIVSDIPGTTRDIIEDHIRLNGINVKLTDTAGVHQSDEQIEQEGIRRSKKALKESDLVLLVMDASKPLGQGERELIAEVPQKKTIAVWNKIDLDHQELEALSLPFVTHVSAKSKKGLEELHRVIDEVIWEHGPPDGSEVMITSVRHKEALDQAIDACDRVMTALGEDSAPELISIDMRNCLMQLGKIIGTHVTEDILSAIFSKFCIGK